MHETVAVAHRLALSQHLDNRSEAGSDSRRRDIILNRRVKQSKFFRDVWVRIDQLLGGLVMQPLNITSILENLTEMQTLLTNSTQTYVYGPTGIFTFYHTSHLVGRPRYPLKAKGVELCDLIEESERQVKHFIGNLFCNMEWKAIELSKAILAKADVAGTTSQLSADGTLNEPYTGDYDKPNGQRLSQVGTSFHKSEGVVTLASLVQSSNIKSKNDATRHSIPSTVGKPSLGTSSAKGVTFSSRAQVKYFWKHSSSDSVVKVFSERIPS